MASTVKVGRAQYIGSRGEQQDVCGISDEDDIDFIQHGGVLAVVADGVGGHAYGGDASALAVHEFMRAYKRKLRRAGIADALYSSLKKANAAIREFAEIQGAEGDCGTTLVAAVVHPKSRAFHWLSVGDSRLYLLRGEEWVQITADGNYARLRAKRIARGMLSEEEREVEGNLGILTSFLGAKRLTGIDRSLRPFPLHLGDWLVLCTDGLFKTLSQEEIVECLRDEPQAACDRLVRAVAAKDLKSQDNCTVVILGHKPVAAPNSTPANLATGQASFGNILRHPSLGRWLRIALILLAALWLWGYQLGG